MPLSRFQALRKYLNTLIIGQPVLTENLLIALVANGHLLVEGPPGLAKTRAVKALCDGVEGDFHRIQFTPDLLPADLTGTDIYVPRPAPLSLSQAPYSTTLFWRMKLTVRRPRYSRHCWRPWPKVRLLWARQVISCPSSFW